MDLEGERVYWKQYVEELPSGQPVEYIQPQPLVD